MVSGVCVLVFGTVVLEGREINDHVPPLRSHQRIGKTVMVTAECITGEIFGNSCNRPQENTLGALKGND